MKKTQSFSVRIQYILPQHLISRIAGMFANARIVPFKNWLIRKFIKTYRVSLVEAMIEQPEAYDTFNHFFTRQLKPHARPIDQQPHTITSPVDGIIAQIGTIQQKILLQAKQFYFDLDSLLANTGSLSKQFENGAYATLYLAPSNYHRVHLPIDGQLIQTIYVPGQLFSVNQKTSAVIPNIFSRNERLIAILNTAIGPMAIILIGAMIVGNIKTVWTDSPIKGGQIKIENFTNGIKLAKGDELGYFQLGSTVILLFAKNAMRWDEKMTVNSPIKMGERIAHYHAG
ncbi:MAG: phosphatidylserine decarboxylase [Gammaproteobacteria bacterium RIFCSPHIGHO2_12_FULL_42_10]|nr:MAG: phosphatidylserine decarboxylase [Gammaproteobacteria bacterium RIFCSPHIGHO2_12_FULL_42_10]